MYSVKVLLLLIIVSGGSHAHIALYNKNNHYIRDLALFAARAYHSYCDYCRATLIIHDDDEYISHYFFKLLTRQDFNMSIVSMSLGKADSEYEMKGKFVGTVIELTIIFWSERYFNKVDYFLDSLEKSPFWHRNSKIIIIASGRVPSNYIPWLEYTFRKFWKRKILRVFMCLWLNEHVHVYMFNPFKGEFANNISNSTNRMFNFYLEYELFDLRQYPIKTYILDIDQYNLRISYEGKDRFGRRNYFGMDGYFMTETRNILNASLDIHRESEQELLYQFMKNDHGKSNTSLIRAFLQKYDFDIWFTAISAYRGTEVDFLFLHERDDICLVVPTGAPVPQYLYFFLVIPIEMWLGLIASLLVMTIFLRFLHRRVAMLDTYRVILNVPLVNLVQPVYLPESIILGTWIIFALFATAVFQCTLTSTLVLPRYYKDIETIKDLIRANLTVYARANEKKIFADNMRPEELILLGNIKTAPLTLKTMMAKQGNNGFLVRSELARTFIKYVKIRRDGRPRYHVMREHPVPNAQTYIMPTRHPYFEEILWIINKVHESGLYYIWRRRDFGWAVKTVKYAKENRMDVPKSGNKYVPLSTVHLQSAFFLLVIGVLIAIVIFLVELFWKNEKKRFGLRFK